MVGALTPRIVEHSSAMLAQIMAHFKPEMGSLIRPSGSAEGTLKAGRRCFRAVGSRAHLLPIRSLEHGQALRGPAAVKALSGRAWSGYHHGEK
jgi:hypothetical protein